MTILVLVSGFHSQVEIGHSAKIIVKNKLPHFVCRYRRWLLILRLSKFIALAFFPLSCILHRYQSLASTLDPLIDWIYSSKWISDHPVKSLILALIKILVYFVSIFRFLDFYLKIPFSPFSTNTFYQILILLVYIFQ